VGKPEFRKTGQHITGGGSVTLYVRYVPLTVVDQVPEKSSGAAATPPLSPPPPQPDIPIIATKNNPNIHLMVSPPFFVSPEKYSRHQPRRSLCLVAEHCMKVRTGKVPNEQVNYLHNYIGTPVDIFGKRPNMNNARLACTN
ncbi:MAG: hypothetical protein ACOYL3_26665, partial [Desulfuromonadaceae bacterium]